LDGIYILAFLFYDVKKSEERGEIFFLVYYDGQTMMTIQNPWMAADGMVVCGDNNNNTWWCGDNDDKMMMKKKRQHRLCWCFVCGLQLESKNLFRHWTRSHAQGNRCVIADCGMRTDDRREMFDHYRADHRLDGRSHTCMQRCDVCALAKSEEHVWFETKLALWKHECTYHADDKADEWIPHSDVEEEDAHTTTTKKKGKRAMKTVYAYFEAKKRKTRKEDKEFEKVALMLDDNYVGCDPGYWNDDHEEEDERLTRVTCMDPVVLT
jgi:hypothetical protein